MGLSTLFFFSSRRRHTISDRDWSSDVCSSDLFIAYTVKGWGTPLAGHKDNHAGQMTGSQIEQLRAQMDIRPGHEWDPFGGLSASRTGLETFLAAVPFNTNASRRLTSPRVKSIGPLPLDQAPTSTQTAFGKILD